MRKSCISILSGLSLAMGLAVMVPMPAHAQTGADLLADIRRQDADPAMQAYRKKDYDVAIAIWTPRAEAGETEAQYWLGYMYAQKENGRQDYAKAMAWFRKAADQGHRNAQLWIGRMYERGEGAAVNYATAAEWYGKACAQTHDFACFSLGRLHERGGPGLAQDLVEAYIIYEQWILAIPPNAYRDAGQFAARDALKPRLTPEQMATATRRIQAQYPAYDPNRPAVQKLPPPAPPAPLKLDNRELIQMAANAQYGSVAHQTKLGQTFLGRNGVKADFPLAVAWLSKAAEQNYDYAQAELGGLYLAGTGVAKDPAVAAAWFSKAAAQGHGYAQYQLGKLYRDGEGVAQNDVQAYVWFDLATRSSHGVVVGSGEAEARDAIAAGMTPDQLTQGRRQVEAWQPAALSVHSQVDAQAHVYSENPEAFAALTALAEAGNAQAQFRMGFICEIGSGGPQDEAAAVVWYEKAAMQGHASAQSQLGNMYAEGRGVRRDYKAAKAWLEKASDQNIADAQFTLGAMYLQGKGVKKKPEVAFGLFYKAAIQGDGMSLLFLGVITFYGDGTAKDPVEAYKWVRLAEIHAPYASAREGAKKRQQEFARTMTPEEIARAESLVKAWSPTIPMP